MKKVIVALICFLITGCIKESKKGAIDVRECEARLVDIAIPLESKPIRKLLSQQTFVYAIKKTREEIVSFYEQEMERLGWDLLAADSNQETLLIFNKPHRVSTVSIRGSGKRKQVYITVLPKK